MPFAIYITLMLSFSLLLLERFHYAADDIIFIILIYAMLPCYARVRALLLLLQAQVISLITLISLLPF